VCVWGVWGCGGGGGGGAERAWYAVFPSSCEPHAVGTSAQFQEERVSEANNLGGYLVLVLSCCRMGVSQARCSIYQLRVRKRELLLQGRI
jgi:hypothetical protein